MRAGLLRANLSLFESVCPGLVRRRRKKPCFVAQGDLIVGLFHTHISFGYHLIVSAYCVCCCDFGGVEKEKELLSRP